MQEREAGDGRRVVAARSRLAGAARGRAIALRDEPREHLAERHLPFADEDERRARAQVRLGLVGRVVTRDDHGQAPRARAADHGDGRLAHPRQAHLREPVERVVVEDDDVGPGAIERRGEARRVVVEHRVEQVRRRARATGACAAAKSVASGG